MDQVQMTKWLYISFVKKLVKRYKREKFTETRKAKIRLSNIKIEEFTQVLKGMSKPIK